MKSFSALIWQSFVRLNGLLLGGLGLLLTILIWWSGPETKIRLGIVAPIGVVFVIMLAVVFDAAYSAWQVRLPTLPKVIYATRSASNASGIQLLCLLEPSEGFSYGLQVGFYYKNEDGFEILVGVGHVVNIQDDKRIQVGMTRTSTGQEPTVELIGENKKSVIERVRIKPSIPHDALELSVRTIKDGNEQKRIPGDGS